MPLHILTSASPISRIVQRLDRGPHKPSNSLRSYAKLAGASDSVETLTELRWNRPEMTARS